MNASEVEEDDEATGWSPQQDGAIGGVSMPAYPEGPTKPRKNKQDSMGKTHFEGEFKSLRIGPDHCSHATMQHDDGWQVATSRKARQVPSNPNPPPPTNHFSVSLNQAFPSLPSRPCHLSPPTQRYDNTAPLSGHGDRAGYSGTSSIGGHGEGAGFGGTNGSTQQWRVSDAAPQRLRNFPDNSRFAPQNELGGISTAMERDKVSLQELMRTAKDLMRNAEVAVRSFVILRSRFSRTVGPVLASNSVPTTGTVATSIGMGAPGPTQAVSSTLPVVDFYSGVPIKPSPFLLHTVTRFEHQLQEFRQWVEELERLLFADTDESGKDSSQLSLLQSLPLVLTNIHDFFIHVAAKVETLHQQTWSRRTTYLANQRKRGDDNNPFLEADRREVAKKEAAAKRVHPTLQASTASQLSTQAAGLLSNAAPSSAPSSGPSSSSSLLFSGSTPFSAFNAAGSLTSASAPSFSTPSLSLFSSTSAPSSSFFGSSGPPTAPSLFGSGTSSSIFGSGPAGGTSASPLSAFSGASAASSSSNLFGGTAMPAGGLFGSSTPTLGGQTPGSIFGNPAQPMGAGTGPPAFGIGTTQGATTTKAKTRTTRRK